MIENFEQLGINISYDRVLQLESLPTRNLCEQFKKGNIVCPSQLRKGTVTVRAIDNLDLNLPSTSAQGSFHGTAIRIIQHPTIEKPGEIRRIQLSTNPSLKEADLPEYYSIAPAATNKKATIKIPNINNEIDQATQDKITSKHIVSAIEKNVNGF